MQAVPASPLASGFPVFPEHFFPLCKLFLSLIILAGLLMKRNQPSAKNIQEALDLLDEPRSKSEPVCQPQMCELPFASHPSFRTCKVRMLAAPHACSPPGTSRSLELCIRFPSSLVNQQVHSGPGAGDPRQTLQGKSAAPIRPGSAARHSLRPLDGSHARGLLIPSVNRDRFPEFRSEERKTRATQAHPEKCVKCSFWEAVTRGLLPMPPALQESDSGVRTGC